MLALIRKDLIAGRGILLLGFVVWVALAGAALSSQHAALELFVVHLIATLALAVGPVMLEDVHDVDALVLLLPPSRRQVVRARYLLMFGAVLFGAASLLALGQGLDRWFGIHEVTALCTLEAVTVFGVLAAGSIALFLPCLFRFGFGRGTFVFFVLVLGLSVVLTVVLRAVGAGLVEGFEVPAESSGLLHVLVAFVDHLATQPGRGVFYGALVTIGLAATLGSLRLATRSFEARAV